MRTEKSCSVNFCNFLQLKFSQLLSCCSAKPRGSPRALQPRKNLPALYASSEALVKLSSSFTKKRKEKKRYWTGGFVTEYSCNSSGLSVRRSHPSKGESKLGLNFSIFFSFTFLAYNWVQPPPPLYDRWHFTLPLGVALWNSHKHVWPLTRSENPLHKKVLLLRQSALLWLCS